jgi:hypothetical protein
MNAKGLIFDTREREGDILCMREGGKCVVHERGREMCCA